MVKVAKSVPPQQETDFIPYEGEGPWFKHLPDSEADVRESKTGLANFKEGVPSMTVPQIFEQAVKINGNKAALKSEMMPPIKKGEKPADPTDIKKWKSWTWNQYYADARACARGFISLGLDPHATVNIFGFNSPQWLMAATGAILAGGKAGGIYPSDNADSVRYKTDHSDAGIAVVENEACMEKYREVADHLPKLKAIVAWACNPGEDITTSDGRTIKVMTFDDLLKLGREKADLDEALNERIANQKPGHCCMIVYTSGTTGYPKAVMISHDNVIFTSTNVLVNIPAAVEKKTPDEERIISYLPLSHVAGAMVDIIAPMVFSANVKGLKGNCWVGFARAYDLKLGTLAQRLQSIRPTLFLGVPRVWEKIMEKLRAVGATTKGLKKVISTYAKKQGAKYTSARQLGGSGKTPNMALAGVILNAIKGKLGLDKCKFMFSGAAPMTMDCLNYFGSLGITVNEVYGMSETTGGSTWSNDYYTLAGSIGFALPSVQIDVLDKDGKPVERANDIFNPSEAEQGEICFRGRSMMMGYMANPRLGEEHVNEVIEKNKGAIDERGWLHSGDKGTVGKNGMFKITGRYKELIIGAGGENIAPVPIEDEMKRLCPFISNIMMVGNLRKFNVCVISLKTVGATGELPGSTKLDESVSSVCKSKTLPEAMEDETLIKLLKDALTQTNGNAAIVPNNAAKIQKFTILPRDFSVLTGEITPSLKLKRSVAEETFKPIIDKMYEVDEQYVNYNTAPTVGLNMGGVEGSDAKPEYQRNLSFNAGQALADATAEPVKAV